MYTYTFAHRKACKHIGTQKLNANTHILKYAHTSTLSLTLRLSHSHTLLYSVMLPLTCSYSQSLSHLHTLLFTLNLIPILSLTLIDTETSPYICTLPYMKHTTPSLFFLFCIIVYEACPHPQHVRSLTDCTRRQMINQLQKLNKAFEIFFIFAA